MVVCMVVPSCADLAACFRGITMHDNTLVYGRFKYTRGIILRLAGNSQAWGQRRVAPPALGGFLFCVPGPYGPGYPMPPLAGLVRWLRYGSRWRFALEGLVQRQRKLAARQAEANFTRQSCSVS
jgi:hypothetical protein